MLSEFFNMALSEVSRVTEIDKDEILSPSRRSDVVDARSLLICILMDRGFSAQAVAGKLSMTRAGVKYCYSSYVIKQESSIILRMYTKEVQRKLQITSK